MIYEPREDSYFFEEFLEKYLKKLPKNSKALDMGTGSGILAKKIAEFLGAKNTTASDINQEAIGGLKKEKFRKIKSDLFERINEKFDLIVFNAPYLPKDGREPEDSSLATTGGEKGDEISIKFLKQAKNRLKKCGKILLLVSSLTPMSRIKKFSPRIAARKKLGFEDLIILEFSKESLHKTNL